MPLDPVRNSSDLERILALPRKREYSDELKGQLVRAYSHAYLTDYGRAKLAEVDVLPTAARL